jgi:diguanylate cyclase (GGDEF)-like protein
MADVDDLKVVNDTLGHAAGDELLRQIAGLFRGAFRSEDIVARVGGDEFAVLLPETDEMAAGEVIERIRRTLKEWGSLYGAPLSISLGLGVAESCEGLMGALTSADQSMYKDKLARTGRAPRQKTHYVR